MQTLITEHGHTQRQACHCVGLSRSTAQYTKHPPDDTALVSALAQLTEKHPAIGVWQSHHRMRLMGHRWNFKRVYRVYTAMGLNIRRRAKKRLPARVKQALFQPGGGAYPFVQPVDGSLLGDARKVVHGQFAFPVTADGEARLCKGIIFFHHIL